MRPGRFFHRRRRNCGLSAHALVRELGVPSNRITAILASARGVTAKTAILLGERFDTVAAFWLNL